jgi:hypothetical protein
MDNELTVIAEKLATMKRAFELKEGPTCFTWYPTLIVNVLDDLIAATLKGMS